MNIERIKNDKGEFRCFEIDNRIISRNGMAQVVSMLEGTNVNHSPKFYDDEVFCKFEFKGHEFEIGEARSAFARGRAILSMFPLRPVARTFGMNRILFKLLRSLASMVSVLNQHSCG